MPRTNAQKLQIKPGDELVLGPLDPAQRALLDPLPEHVQVVEGLGRDTAGVVVLFARDRAQLDELLARALPPLTAPRAVWAAYPKGGRADINRDSIWARAQELGWRLNANVSLSEVWSAVRFAPQP